MRCIDCQIVRRVFSFCFYDEKLKRTRLPHDFTKMNECVYYSIEVKWSERLYLTRVTRDSNLSYW